DVCAEGASSARTRRRVPARARGEADSADRRQISVGRCNPGASFSRVAEINRQVAANPLAGGVNMERARINGIEVAYELRGSGAPLVMIHGAQGDQSMFAGLVAAFAPSYRVLTFDQRGTGLSEKPDMPYTIALLADDTAALMDHVGIADAHI